MPERPDVGIAVRRVVLADVAQLSASLARAFHDDPVSVHLFPGEGRRPRRLERYFRYHLRTLFLPKGEAWTTDDLAAASLWIPPGPRVATAGETIGQVLPIVSILGSRLPRALRLVQLLESHHPKSPHFYLGGLGTDPVVRGKGYASALLRVVLERCDTLGMASYLENSNVNNLALYHRHGYEVIGEITIPQTTVRLWLMWREPGGGGPAHPQRGDV